MDNAITSQVAEEVLPESLPTKAIEALVAQWRERPIAPGEHRVMDASQTQIISTPALQALLALSRSLTQAGGSLFLRDAHPALEEACATLGIEPSFLKGPHS